MYSNSPCTLRHSTSRQRACIKPVCSCLWSLLNSTTCPFWKGSVFPPAYGLFPYVLPFAFSFGSRIRCYLHFNQIKSRLALSVIIKGVHARDNKQSIGHVHFKGFFDRDLNIWRRDTVLMSYTEDKWRTCRVGAGSPDFLIFNPPMGLDHFDSSSAA